MLDLNITGCFRLRYNDISSWKSNLLPKANFQMMLRGSKCKVKYSFERCKENKNETCKGIIIMLLIRLENRSPFTSDEKKVEKLMLKCWK